MPHEQADSPLTNQAIEDLALCLTEAANQIAVLRDAIDELRDDFSWALRNLQPAELPHHVILKRMAADPTADDWNERLQLIHPDRRETAETVHEPAEELIERVGTIISQIATEQLEMILVSLNELRDHLIAATGDDRTSEETSRPLETDATDTGTVVARSMLSTETQRAASTASPPEDYVHPQPDRRQQSLWDDEPDH